MSAVPDVLVPEQIKAQVNARYPGAVIIRLKKDRTGYDIKLSNGLDIEFNKRFVITDIDD